MQADRKRRRTVAAIGSTVSGLTAAYLLSARADGSRLESANGETMGAVAADPTRFLVTLGSHGHIDPDKVIAEMTYHHPLFTPESVAAQKLLPSLNDDRVAFAGAYHGWGFHEDGAVSGRNAAEHLGAQWPARPEMVAA